ncbi:hypothetical protein [Neptuniibacter sp.]|uniref:hypothetical protein n=1 Tax=Neptuniibacter sp. TaxID=1962643 RepID=UPI00262DA12C|nr:hypothetical protein [Neptuniibacter sp.]MCP4598618.1 hypothetical protein [Neptuniibacter sp.]
MTQVVVVLSSYSTGSTALVGYLDRLGGYTCPPHQMTNDERTPNSYEPKALQVRLTRSVDEFTFRSKKKAAFFSEWFSRWITQEQEKAAELGLQYIVLKHPLLAFFIEEINELCSPKFVVITRPASKIEATRLRRGWHKSYGQVGANVIYPMVYSKLAEHGLNALCISFESFAADTEIRQKLMDWLSISPTGQQIEDAEGWLR